MLFFKRHLLDLIRTGKKNARPSASDPPARPRRPKTPLVPGLGRVRHHTRSTRSAPSGELTAADARADGFPTLKTLLAELETIYGPAPGGKARTLYRVRFDYPFTSADKISPWSRPEGPRGQPGPPSPSKSQTAQPHQKQIPCMSNLPFGNPSKLKAQAGNPQKPALPTIAPPPRSARVPPPTTTANSSAP